jgi:hypothetical protein
MVHIAMQEAVDGSAVATGGFKKIYDAWFD